MEMNYLNLIKYCSHTKRYLLLSLNKILRKYYKNKSISHYNVHKTFCSLQNCVERKKERMYYNLVSEEQEV